MDRVSGTGLAVYCSIQKGGGANAALKAQQATEDKPTIQRKENHET
jgi:hypothetical protein